MCGICGVIFFDSERQLPRHTLKQMCDTIVHRGPDDEGYYIQGAVGLGMRRLSIIDLDTGSQPIRNEDGQIWIVFNGEIYNYRELRQDLEKKGHRFYTRSDTESIVHAYEEYGDACPAKLNGMFGFAIWDNYHQRLFLARDRLGIKPLYYYLDNEKFAFGSEIKSILQLENLHKSIDFDALNNYLTFEYIPSPRTIFNEIKKLPPGHTLILQQQQIRIQKYWDVQFEVQPEQKDHHAATLRELLQDSVRLRLVSDVPLGAFLSGGIDSSSIVGLMAQLMDRPVKTFSIGFEDSSYNELDYARIVAKKFNTEHTEFIIKPNAVELVEKLITHLDEPFGDFSIFPTYLVSKMAREHVTVALSGDGGDELFAGYDTYLANRLASYYQKLPRILRANFVEPIVDAIPPTSKKKGSINMLKRFVEGAKYDPNLHHVRWMIFLSEVDRQNLLNPQITAVLTPGETYRFIEHYFSQADIPDTLNRQEFVDVKTYLVDDILVKVDRMSMATSLETRVPFLDHRLVEYSFAIPSCLKLRRFQTKYILKKAMGDLLPPQILKRGKQGFSIPIKNWIRQELRPMLLDVLSYEKLKRQGIFNADYVHRLINEHLQGVENHSHRLWALMVFELWDERYAN
ncbi:asparagine synthase (glutamine-hydrolyzing) [candidate division KSB1 bacterium]|nr:MAG: asparagine synthase (glutamine-hydrolyzing) [candidate division KSB1 bacterium]RKY89652.1 MAG: asparagine synthase (glutamine-hydrolyzing) [candidate division KSB1 bacterium]